MSMQGPPLIQAFALTNSFLAALLRRNQGLHERIQKYRVPVELVRHDLFADKQVRLPEKPNVANLNSVERRMCKDGPS